MKENIITHFFFFFPHVASIRNPPNPPIELTQSQNPSLGCFPSKEANSRRDLGVPYYVVREWFYSPTSQREVERLNLELKLME